MSEIPNDDLRPEAVPGLEAEWYPTIAEFALSFDGYEAMGNRLSNYASRRFERWKRDGSLPRDLSHIRWGLLLLPPAVLWAEYGPDHGPTADDLAYAHAL